jgi:DNA-binding IclR family transcriptional regulator
MRPSRQERSEFASNDDVRPDRNSSVGRALRILDVVGRHPNNASLSQIARRTGLPKTTVHRLLADLESHRAVERVLAGYRLGELALTLGATDARYDVLRRAVMPYLVDLYLDVGETVSLGILRDFRVIYLETLYSPSQSGTVLRTAQRAPAHATAAGKLLLAHSPGVAERYGREAVLESFTENTITSAASLADELSQILRDGVAFNREEYVVGLIGVAGPVNGADGRPIAAVTVGGPSDRLDLDRAEAKLRAAVHTVSAVVRHTCTDGLRGHGPGRRYCCPDGRFGHNG